MGVSRGGHYVITSRFCDPVPRKNGVKIGTCRRTRGNTIPSAQSTNGPTSPPVLNENPLKTVKRKTQQSRVKVRHDREPRSGAIREPVIRAEQQQGPNKNRPLPNRRGLTTTATATHIGSARAIHLQPFDRGHEQNKTYNENDARRTADRASSILHSSNLNKIFHAAQR